MAVFRLTSPAIRDFVGIVTYHHRNSGEDVATHVEGRLFGAFFHLGSRPEAGHRRGDLTARNILFHYERPYFILFRRIAQNAQILRVVHESHDLRKFVQRTHFRAQPLYGPATQVQT